MRKHFPEGLFVRRKGIRVKKHHVLYSVEGSTKRVIYYMFKYKPLYEMIVESRKVPDGLSYIEVVYVVDHALRHKDGVTIGLMEKYSRRIAELVLVINHGRKIPFSPQVLQRLNSFFHMARSLIQWNPIMGTVLRDVSLSYPIRVPIRSIFPDLKVVYADTDSYMIPLTTTRHSETPKPFGVYHSVFHLTR